MISKSLWVSMKKNIVVTGGAGFIGQHLTRRLLKEGHTVIVFDCFFTGVVGEVNQRSKQNIYALQKQYPQQLIIHEHNIIKPFSLHRPVDEIYN